MSCKECIELIASRGGPMDELTNIFCDALNYLEEKEYKMIKSRLYELAYGETLNEEMAIDYVKEMKPYGEHWSIDQTTQVGNSYGWEKYSKYSFYWTMNMMYNDYHSVLGEDTNGYIKLARAFLIDEDAPKGDTKVFRYIKAMKK